MGHVAGQDGAPVARDVTQLLACFNVPHLSEREEREGEREERKGEREREGERGEGREGQRGRERKREGDREGECVCMVLLGILSHSFTLKKITTKCILSFSHTHTHATVSIF